VAFVRFSLREVALGLGGAARSHKEVLRRMKQQLSSARGASGGGASNVGSFGGGAPEGSGVSALHVAVDRATVAAEAESTDDDSIIYEDVGTGERAIHYPLYALLEMWGRGCMAFPRKSDPVRPLDSTHALPCLCIRGCFQ
jgi:hypothetical protein